ncbi:hypothetical protein BM536_012715 [Streptomyces phaeoluteigriseus]|uniref:PIN domain-containing protein n=1 Tax=Streptomyces phaeoluteigriseus TaxID=114686 RepID=A0A1V6MSK2_9ACTN|nr:hypothetical protein [Streptomyces phaeoluteigriseus]OQD55438.1 hypothetical protein BM536_012715 [Streptomyces phaeoluteigriseus]
MSRTEHFVLDTPTLLALGGDKQVSGLIHAAAASDDMRLWVPVLCLVEAERRRAGIVDHVGVLVDVLHVVEDDFAMAVTIARLGSAGVDFGVAAAVHAVSPNQTLPMGGLIATVAPDPYTGLGVGVMDLNR